ncbi:hypothetical protein CCP2SC5_30031 [Azospirillaceae bacterium]
MIGPPQKTAPSVLPIVPSIILVAALAVSVAMWSRARDEENARAQSLFEQEAESLRLGVELRLNTFQTILQAARALTAAKAADWRHFVAALEIEGSASTIRALFSAESHSSSAFRAGDYSPRSDIITLVEPPQKQRPGIGFDLHSIPDWSERARRAAILGRMVLAPLLSFETGDGTGKPSADAPSEWNAPKQKALLLALPIYRSDFSFSSASEAERWDALVGWVGLFFHPTVVLNTAQRSLQYPLHVALSDVTDPEHTISLAEIDASSDSNEDLGFRGEWTRVLPLTIGDRIWHLRLSSLSALENASHTGQPMFILLAGLGLSVALWVVAYLLQDSRQRFRDLAESASDWFWETDSGQKFCYISDRFFEVSGLQPNDILGKTPWQFLSEISDIDSRVCALSLRHMEIMQAHARFRDLEFLIRDREGKLRTVLLSGKPSFHENSVFRGYRGTGADITERKNAEKVADQIYVRLKAAIGVMPNGIIMFDRDQNLIVYNQKFLDLWRLSEEQIKECFSITGLVRYFAARGDYGEGDVEALVHDRIAMIMSENACSYELSLSWGRILEVQGYGRPEIGYVLTYLDITERKKGERALRESEERLKTALIVTRAGVWDINLQTGERWWSPQLPEILGYQFSELVFSKVVFEAMIHPEDRTQVRVAAKRHLAGVAPEFRAQYRVLHKRGWWVWFEDVGRVICNADGCPIRFIGTAVDVSERRATQAELMRSEKMAALGRLVAGIAHEINTPIGLGVSIASHIEERTRVLSRFYDDGEVMREDFEEYMQTVAEASTTLLSNLRRAADLVHSFKQVAVDQSSEQKRIFKLKAYIDEVLVSMRPKLKKTRHKVIIDCPDGLTLNSYPGAVSQLLTNLIDNSLIHGFEDMGSGTIIISVFGEVSDVIIAYSDNGKGMTEEQTERIFEPFFTSKMGQGGSGLGMHIVYNLVTKTLGGTIRCVSLPGRGISVIVRIPLHPPLLERHERVLLERLAQDQPKAESEDVGTSGLVAVSEVSVLEQAFIDEMANTKNKRDIDHEYAA